MADLRIRMNPALPEDFDNNQLVSIVHNGGCMASKDFPRPARSIRAPIPEISQQTPTVAKPHASRP